MSLCEQFNLEAAEQTNRQEFIWIDADCINTLKEQLPFVEKNVYSIVEKFYDQLLQYSEPQRFFGNSSMLEKLKSAQREYLIDIFRGKYDKDYFERRLHIGVVHERIGLELKWYIGGNSNFFTLLHELFAKRYRWQPKKSHRVISAISKVMNLDQQLVIDTYIGSMVNKITRVSDEIEVATSTLASTATELSSTILTQQKTTSEQSASVTETTATVSELNTSAQKTAEDAESMANAASDGVAQAQEGTHMVDDSLDTMKMLQNRVQDIATQILNLSEKTSQIEHLTKLVSEIANKTNLLALNAAVEAARAGEYGKGFAVVAVEIRRLADQSKKSLEQINQLVDEIQTSTNTTVMVTEEGTKTVTSGVEKVLRSGDVFRTLAEALEVSFDRAQQISLNARQQSIAINQVGEAMTSINEGAQQTANGINQTQQSVDVLMQTAQKLKTLVDHKHDETNKVDSHSSASGERSC